MSKTCVLCGNSSEEVHYYIPVLEVVGDLGNEWRPEVQQHGKFGPYCQPCFPKVRDRGLTTAMNDIDPKELLEVLEEAKAVCDVVVEMYRPLPEEKDLVIRLNSMLARVREVVEKALKSQCVIADGMIELNKGLNDECASLRSELSALRRRSVRVDVLRRWIENRWNRWHVDRYDVERVISQIMVKLERLLDVRATRPSAEKGEQG